MTRYVVQERIRGQWMDRHGPYDSMLEAEIKRRRREHAVEVLRMRPAVVAPMPELRVVAVEGDRAS